MAPKGWKANIEVISSLKRSPYSRHFFSAKDPNWSKHAGREDKSTCILITGARWEWYEEFKETTLHKRGDEYEEIKVNTK